MVDNLYDKPLAAPGLTSYRCRNRYGWTMIGAASADDAMREARRSWEGSRPEDLQIWDVTSGKYVPALPERCPTCAAPVASVFDHVDQDCEHD